MTYNVFGGMLNLTQSVNLYLITDTRVTTMALTCEIYCRELTCLKSFLLFIAPFTNLLTRAATCDTPVM